MRPRISLALALLGLISAMTSVQAAGKDTPSIQQILKASKSSEWRALNPDNTLYMDLPDGRVVIELAPWWSPKHVANIKTLVREHYFDHTSIYRVQDNFVAQWGDPDSDNPKKAKSMGTAKTHLPPEYDRSYDTSMSFTALPDGDVYAPQVGFSHGFPTARDPKTHRTWIAHCYGTVGVARDVDPTSGNGNTLYAVIGQARRIDHNLAVAGRVVQGMPLLSSLPRGDDANIGVYAKPSQRTPILRVRLAADVPAAQREHLQVLRTDSATFARIVDAKRHRHDAFYRDPPGHASLCSLDVPVRVDPKFAH
ncbi:peptidylprolyl isomerase [Oleiagrimonas sp. MCCC 1A03011]|uniref:peptidylprolyl isomerase n=1 Tax=Oleiagrimonas sp. MCCC 1A03011 TaxID=1926883 RepID=UPI000DD8D518|nr:peptidylprolyl isomerase [Oleiagrimonas sp. MCCC 1A03011]